MENLQLLQDLAMSADLMLIEEHNIVRLIWDVEQGSGENKRLNARKRELKELIKVSQSVVKDDGNLHVCVSMDLVNIEELK